MLRTMHKERKRAKDLRFMLGLNEITDQLAMTSSVDWYGDVLRREGGDMLIMALEVEVEGQRKRVRPKRRISFGRKV